MFRKLSCFAAILTLGLPGWAADRNASVSGSSVSGIVRASDGTPQMGAVVEIFASAALSLTVFTNENGFYAASGLKTGTYSLRVSAPSFLPAIRERVSLRSGASAVVNLTLTTIFDALNVVPRSASSSADDDWAWTLRSVANRPILRAVDAKATGERRSPRMAATLAFVAGSDSQGYGGDSGVSTHFTFSRSVLSSGSLVFDGNVGYGESAPAAVVRAKYSQQLANGLTPEISITARRFAPPDPALHAAALHAFSVRFADSMNLANVIELKFGSELQTLQFINRTTALLPFATADVHLSPDTVASYRYASSVPPTRMARDADRLPSESLQAGPRVSVNDFTPALQRSSHHELSVSHRAGKNNLMLAVYRDRLRNTALVGVGAAAGDDGDVLSDPYSGTFTYQGADFHTQGVRAVWERKLMAGLDATFDYAYGGVLELPEGDGVSLNSARGSMHTAQRHAFATRVSGVLPTSHTKWTTSYKWTSGQALTPVDLFNASPGQTDPFLNVVLRQPIPRMGLLPAHMEAVLDLHNLLAEGYVPVMGQDRHTVYLVQSARSVRGGVAITF